MSLKQVEKSLLKRFDKMWRLVLLIIIITVPWLDCWKAISAVSSIRISLSYHWKVELWLTALSLPISRVNLPFWKHSEQIIYCHADYLWSLLALTAGITTIANRWAWEAAWDRWRRAWCKPSMHVSMATLRAATTWHRHTDKSAEILTKPHTYQDYTIQSPATTSINAKLPCMAATNLHWQHWLEFNLS